MSSLRVMLPSGAVVSALKVTPIAERIVCFNGKRRRLTGLAQDMKKEANGILINVEGLKRRVNKSEDIFSSMNTPSQDQVEEHWDDVVIGNLKNEQVQQIVREICEKGYYDFSCFEYQNLESPKDLMLGSEYLPYHNENNLSLCAFSNRNNGYDGYNKFCFTNFYDEDITDEDYDNEAESGEVADSL